MPKIPTFQSTARPTTDVGAITTGIQVSPTSTVAAKILPASDQLANYAIKKRDNEEKLIAKKAILELKSESDKIIQSQKDNISEQESINNWKQTFTPLIKQKTSTITNRRVRKLIEDGINLENSESIYHLKQNSFKAYEEESAKIYNDDINADVAKFKAETNPNLKDKYRDQLYLKAELYNEEHMLGSNDLKKRIESIDSVLLLTDADSLIGTPNAVEKIKQIDKDINGTKFVSDEIFNNSIYNSYKQKIESVAVKGDPNADYEEAERLLNELENFERYNGSKTVSGKREAEFATLKQKILTESIGHDTFVRKIEQGNKFFEYQTEQKKLLESSFFNSFIPTLNKAIDKERAVEAGLEYDERIDLYVQLNQDATYAEQQQYARQLRIDLQDKYEKVTTEEITSFNLEENKFNVIRETDKIIEAKNNYIADPKAKNILITMSRLNGYVDEQGNPEVIKFYNDYIKILKSRQEG